MCVHLCMHSDLGTDCCKKKPKQGAERCVRSRQEQAVNE